MLDGQADTLKGYVVGEVDGYIRIAESFSSGINAWVYVAKS
ncbi:hypothetical protein [Pseudoalteromonas arctica]|nr:hypothetical protein [Pseudoalteromonas arctica]